VCACAETERRNSVVVVDWWWCMGRKEMEAELEQRLAEVIYREEEKGVQ
jgi:hypothetical protein